MRVVGNTCSINDANANTMGGMIGLQGDGWKVLGNTFVNPPNRVIIKNNHAVYIQNGADDVEIAYNNLVNLRMGHVIQVHQDGTPMRYSNIWIHDNLIESAQNTDTRGITVSNVDNESTVLIERNVLRNLGQNFSAISVYKGNVTIKDNRTYAIRAPVIAINASEGGNRSVIATGNRLEPLRGYAAIELYGRPATEITLSGNAYCGVAPHPREMSALPCTP